MPGVSHSPVASLGGALVLPSLEANLGVATLTDVLFGKVAFVFRGHFGTQSRPLVLGVVLGLPGQCVQAQSHLSKIKKKKL